MNKIEKLKNDADLTQVIATVNKLVDAWNNEFDDRTKATIKVELQSGASRSGGKRSASPFIRKP